ncbi:MAG: DUF4365 domain-containing protein [Haliangiales bacterium]
MTPNQRQEELSKAYVAAVAAQCGFKLGRWSQDDDCLDVTIAAAGRLGRGTLCGPKLDVQLKSSSDQKHERSADISWSLKRAHYERLRTPSCVPIVLVVVTLPPDPAAWVVHSPEQLTLRRCGYWHSLRDAPDMTTQHASTTVTLSKQQVFSPAALAQLMERISAGESI